MLDRPDEEGVSAVFPFLNIYFSVICVIVMCILDVFNFSSQYVVGETG
jgi:hypothetical protein